jgi:hypothetical protein
MIEIVSETKQEEETGIPRMFYTFLSTKSLSRAHLTSSGMHCMARHGKRGKKNVSS